MTEVLVIDYKFLFYIMLYVIAASVILDVYLFKKIYDMSLVINMLRTGVDGSGAENILEKLLKISPKTPFEPISTIEDIASGGFADMDDIVAPVLNYDDSKEKSSDGPFIASINDASDIAGMTRAVSEHELGTKSLISNLQKKVDAICGISLKNQC